MDHRPHSLPAPPALYGLRGFSLVEMLITITVLSILTAMVAPRLDTQRFRLNADVRNVVVSLAYAQRLAVSLQHNVQVTVDPALGQLRVHEDKNNDGGFSTDERVRVTALDIGVNFTRGSAPDLPAPAPTNELRAVVFARDGSASVAGVIFMNTAKGVAGGTDRDARVIEVSRSTGRATWYFTDGGTWKRGT